MERITRIAREAGRSHPVLVCSLTRSAAAEAAGRVDLDRRMVGTLHSHAYHQLDAPEIAETHLDDWNERNPGDDEIGGGGGDVDEPGYERRPGRREGDRLYELYNLLRARMVPRGDWPGHVQEFSARWEAWKDELGAMDFTDLIEVALDASPSAPGSPEVVIVDEAQDLSRLELALARRWGTSAGALVLVGDPWQCLYEWRGSEPGVFIDPAIPDSHRDVLGQSFRVPRAAHAVATTFVERYLSDWRAIHYAPTEAEGELTRIPSATWRRPDAIVRWAEERAADGESVMVCASCSYQLEPVVRALRDAGLPFSNPWRRKRGDWNPLGAARGVTMARRVLDLMRPDAETFGGDCRPWTWAEVGRWASVLQARGLIRRGAKKLLEAMASESADATADAAGLAEVFEPGVLDELVAFFTEREFPTGELPPDRDAVGWWLDRVTGSRRRAAEYPARVAMERGTATLLEEPLIHVGTIHSFKGAEADAVLVVPDLSPAGAKEWRSGTARDSVVRQFYVAVTRCRRELAVCAPCERVAVPIDQLMVA